MSGRTREGVDVLQARVLDLMRRLPVATEGGWEGGGAGEREMREMGIAVGDSLPDAMEHGSEGTERQKEESRAGGVGGKRKGRG